MRRIVFALFVCLAAVPAFADKGGRHGDDDDLWEARKRGDVLPLHRILEQIGEDFAARVIEIETERRNGTIVYEIYYLDTEGRRRDIEVDARTGKILPPHEDD